MKEKNKAKELVDKFIQINGNSFFAKDCASLVADELIKYLPSSNGNPPNTPANEYNSEWWLQVKTEIEKL